MPLFLSLMFILHGIYNFDCRQVESGNSLVKKYLNFNLQRLKSHNCHLSPVVGLGLDCTVDVRGGKLLLTEHQ